MCAAPKTAGDAFHADKDRVDLREAAGSSRRRALCAPARARRPRRRVLAGAAGFQRAIGESGGLAISPLRTRQNAEQAGARLGKLADLRAKPANELLGIAVGGPIVDGWFLPEDEAVIFNKGYQNDVPLLVGSNAEEANVLGRPVPAGKYLEETNQRYKELSGAFLKLYPAGNEEQARASQMAALNDSFAWQMRNWARSQVKTGKSDAYLYYFTRQPPADAPVKGAAHDAELYYVFHNLDLYHQQWAEWDRRLEQTISTYWVNFAARGDPNGAGLPLWPKFGEDHADRVMILGDKVEQGASPLDKVRVDFLENYHARQTERNK